MVPYHSQPNGSIHYKSGTQTRKNHADYNPYRSISYSPQLEALFGALLSVLDKDKIYQTSKKLSCTFYNNHFQDRIFHHEPHKACYLYLFTQVYTLDLLLYQYNLRQSNLCNHKFDNRDHRQQCVSDLKEQHKRKTSFHPQCACIFCSNICIFFFYLPNHSDCVSVNETMNSKKTDRYSLPFNDKSIPIIINSMTNIRFTYEQKNQYFGQNRQQIRQNTGIHELLSKYEKQREVDDEQQSQIQRKKIVYHANSLNYSQIYSDLRINRKQKIVAENLNTNNELMESKTFSRHSQVQNPTTQIYVPKALPKIRRNSRLSQHRQSSKYVFNSTFEENGEKDSFSRAKAFSISHYDIFKKQGKQRQFNSAVKSAKPQPDKEQNYYDKQLIQTPQNKEDKLQKQSRQILVNFENQTEKDIPEEKDDQVMSNLSQIEQRKQSHQIQPQLSLQTLGKDKIRLEKQQQDQVKKSKQKVLITDQKPEEKIVIKALKQQIKKQQQMLNKIRRQLSHQSSFNSKKPSKSLKRDDSQKSGQNMKVQMIFNNHQEQEEQNNLPFIKQSLTSLPGTTKKQENLTELKQAQNILSKKQSKKEFKEEKDVHQGKIDKIQAQLKNGQVLINTDKRDYQKKDSPNVVPSKQAHQQQQQKDNKEINKQPQISQRRYEFHKFNVNDYTQVYEILKQIQKYLKIPPIDLHGLIKQVKKYLQVIAVGGLDHIQGYQMPLHRLKIIKNALIYERISVVIIAFAYAIGKIKQCLKYLINLVGYATNNTLLVLKILQACQITTQTKNPVLVKSDRLVLKYNYDSIRNNNDIILDSIFKISKYEEAFYEPFKQILKSIGKNSIEQTFYNVLQYFSFFLCVSDLYKSLPFLSVAPNPYLRESISDKPTLIIDVVEVFCHGTKKSKNHVFRPHTQHFLNQMAQYYEIVSFTCAYPNQIDKVIDILDPKHHIKHRLYRHHAITKNGSMIKDSQRIGRNLSKLVILDSELSATQQINNTLFIPSWKGNKSDTTLAQLCPILAAIALKNIDCKQACQRIRSQQVKNEHAGIKYLNFDIILQ